MSLGVWGDEPPGAECDHLLDAGWIDGDTAQEWMGAMLMAASSCQGGHSQAGKALAEIIGCPFPIRMEELKKRAIEMKFDPAELWPWFEKKE